MALTGLEIFKLLPKTNCGKCGSPTCLAFAMRLAGKKASVDECPDISVASKAALGAASAPPIKLVTIGAGEGKVEIGNETVMFRHEQTFYHPAALAVSLDDNDPALDARLEKIASLKIERVAQLMKVNMVALKCVSADASKFAASAKAAMEKTKLPLALVSSDPAVVEEALKACAGQKPLIGPADAANCEKMAALAKQYSVPLAVSGRNLEELADLSHKAAAAGAAEIVLAPIAEKLADRIAMHVQIRRLALKKTFRPFGYPSMEFARAQAGSFHELAEASAFLCRYGALIVLSGVEAWEHFALMTLRQNIYTDPQKPIQVESKVYEIGAVRSHRLCW